MQVVESLTDPYYFKDACLDPRKHLQNSEIPWNLSEAWFSLVKPHSLLICHSPGHLIPLKRTEKSNELRYYAVLFICLSFHFRIISRQNQAGHSHPNSKKESYNRHQHNGCLTEQTQG